MPASGRRRAVDAGVGRTAVAARDRVVFEAARGCRSRPASREPARQFAGRMKRAYSWRALWAAAQHVLGADDGEQERLGVAVDGREEHQPPGLTRVGAGAHDRGRIGHVFGISMQVTTTSKAAGARRRQRLGRHLAVLELSVPASARVHCATLSGLLARSMPSTFAPRRAIESRMPPPQPTSSTCLPASGRGRRSSPGAGVDLVQRAEFAVRIPPAVGGAR